MASAKKTLNPLTDTPETKIDITKSFMYAYMASEKATLEDVEWFEEICENPDNRKEYKNQLNGEMYEDIDIPKVRKEFITRFYPNLLEKKKNGNQSFTDKIKALKAEKEKQERAKK